MRRGADGVSVVARVVASLRDSGFFLAFVSRHYRAGLQAVASLWDSGFFLAFVSRHCRAGLQVVASLRDSGCWLAFVSRHCRAGLQIVASLRDSGFWLASLTGLRVFAVVRRVLLVGVAACVGLAWGSCAWAQSAGLDVSQYAHTAWRIRDGFTKGAIMAVAQTPDGYLWLGTDSGLVRFDGVRAVPWQPPNGEQLPTNTIRKLLVARDGTLWISTWKGLASWKEGKLETYPEVGGQVISALSQDGEGTIWFGAYPPSRLCAVRVGKIQCYGTGEFGLGVYGLLNDQKGSLWVASDTGAWRWSPGTPEHYLSGVSVSLLFKDEKGDVVIPTSDGLKRIIDGKIQSYSIPGATGKFRVIHALWSRDGSLWLSTNQGLLHVRQGKTDTFGSADGLTGDRASSIFEDREGNIWVSTLNRLDRFRQYTVPSIAKHQGFSGSVAYAVQAVADGGIWIGTPDRLNRWTSGHMTVYGRHGGREPKEQRDELALSVGGPATEITNSGLAGTPRSLGLDDRGRLWIATADGVFYFEARRFIRVPGLAGGTIFGIVGDGQGKVWISGNPGLFHVAPGGDVESIPWSALRHQGYGAIAPLVEKGGIWLGFGEGRLVYFKDGQVRASYTAADGLGNGRVSQLRFGSRNGVWAATEGGLSRLKDGHIETLSSKNGLPCDTVHWSMEDDDHNVWLYMPCGLARIDRSEWYAWVDDPKRFVKITVFDNSDGVTGVGVLGGYGPHVTKAPDGKIWFVTYDGVSVIDPRHLAYNKVVPPVQIEQITADGKTYDASSSNEKGGLRLPPLVRNLSIDYTALSLAVPEKVHFRFRLEGQDQYWREVVNDRQVEYSNLVPKKYRFRVIASNNSGVWNETGASLEFSIAPAYYQTNWFRALCVAAFLALLWVLYQYRLYQIQREFNAGLEARVSERLRIARELHDTLLQSFQGLLLRFQAAANFLPNRPEEAKETLETAMDLGSQAIAEGREAVQGLRASTTVTNELAVALSALAKELGGNEPSENAPAIRVVVEGEPCDLHPLLRDEVYRIAGEAMRNSYRHAQATRIEVEIHYDAGQLRLRIRDDGKGIGREVIEGDGRSGHWGLHGMRERARIIGGKLEVWSAAQEGTEVELKIPARAAYARAGRRRKGSVGKS